MNTSSRHTANVLHKKSHPIIENEPTESIKTDSEPLVRKSTTQLFKHASSLLVDIAKEKEDPHWVFIHRNMSDNNKRVLFLLSKYKEIKNENDDLRKLIEAMNDRLTALENPNFRKF